MNLALFRRVGDFERLQGAPGVQGIAVRIDQIALQATDHHLTQALFVWEDVARETLVVEQFQQRGERLGVAVVWSRRQEQAMLEVRADGTDEARALTLQRVVRACGGRDVVGFVHDQQIEFARMTDVRRDHVVHGAQVCGAARGLRCARGHAATRGAVCDAVCGSGKGGRHDVITPPDAPRLAPTSRA